MPIHHVDVNILKPLDALRRVHSQKRGYDYNQNVNVHDSTGLVINLSPTGNKLITTGTDVYPVGDKFITIPVELYYIRLLSGYKL